MAEPLCTESRHQCRQASCCVFHDPPSHSLPSRSGTHALCSGVRRSSIKPVCTSLPFFANQLISPAFHLSRLVRFDKARRSKDGLLATSGTSFVHSRASISPRVRRLSAFIHASILKPSTLEQIVNGIRKSRIGSSDVSRTTCPLYLIIPTSYVGFSKSSGRCQRRRRGGQRE